MRNLSVALLVVIAVLGGFYSGWKYSQSKGVTAAAATTASSPIVAGTATGSGAGAGAGAGAGTGAGAGAGAGGARGNFVTGQVTAVGTGTITIHDRVSNADVKVVFDATTPIIKQSTGQVSDLANGANVTVTGPRGADGSVAAQGIQIGGGRGAAGG